MGEAISRKTVLVRQSFRREARSQSETISRSSSAGREGCWVDGCSVSIAPSTASMEASSEMLTSCWGWWTMGEMEEEESGVDEVRSAWSVGEMCWLKGTTGC
jgi:hypothetical protein